MSHNQNRVVATKYIKFSLHLQGWLGKTYKHGFQDLRYSDSNYKCTDEVWHEIKHKRSQSHLMRHNHLRRDIISQNNNFKVTTAKGECSWDTQNNSLWAVCTVTCSEYLGIFESRSCTSDMDGRDLSCCQLTYATFGCGFWKENKLRSPESFVVSGYKGGGFNVKISATSYELAPPAPAAPAARQSGDRAGLVCVPAGRAGQGRATKKGQPKDGYGTTSVRYGQESGRTAQVQTFSAGLQARDKTWVWLLNDIHPSNDCLSKVMGSIPSGAG